VGIEVLSGADPRFLGLKRVCNRVWLITDLPRLPGLLELFYRECVGSVCQESVSLPTKSFVLLLFLF